MNSNGQRLQAVDFLKIHRELNDLILLLQSVPPDDDEVDARIVLQCRRIQILLPENLDLADCSLKFRSTLKALKPTVTDSEMLSISELQWFANALDPHQSPVPAPVKTSTRLAKPVKKKRPGRKPPDPKAAKREQDLIDRWNRARDAGTRKIDFAVDYEMTLRQLEAMIDRVRKRNKRSE